MIWSKISWTTTLNDNYVLVVTFTSWTTTLNDNYVLVVTFNGETSNTLV